MTESAWENMSLESVLKLASGKTKPPCFVTPQEKVSESIPVYGGNGINGYCNTPLVNDPKIIIGRVGEYCGSVFLSDGPAWITDNALYTKEFDKKNDLKYFFYLLRYLNLSKLRSKGGQPLISQGPIHSLVIPIPPLPEQKKIAEILSCWDRGIVVLENTAYKYRQKFNAFLDFLLIEHLGMEECPLAAIGEVCSLYNGRAFKPAEWGSSGLPIIRIQNLNGSGEFNYFQGEFDERNLIKPNDLLFSWSGSRGTSFGPYLWNGSRGVLNQHIFKVEARDTIEKVFLYFTLLAITRKIEHVAHGSAGLVHVTKQTLESFEIPVPNLTTQIKTQKFLSSLKQQADLARDLCAIFKKQKQGLMQKLLTGQVRVNV